MQWIDLAITIFCSLPILVWVGSEIELQRRD